jgi:hypothetical protein
MLIRLIWPNEAVAANVSDEADASNSDWVNMADANKSNDGKFDFCRTMTSSSSVSFQFDFCRTMTSLSSVSFPLFLFSSSPSQNIVKPLLK